MCFLFVHISFWECQRHWFYYFSNKCSIFGRCFDANVLIANFQACDINFHRSVHHFWSFSISLSLSLSLVLAHSFISLSLFVCQTRSRFRSHFHPPNVINLQISKIVGGIIYGTEFDVDLCWWSDNKNFWFIHLNSLQVVATRTRRIISK